MSDQSWIVKMREAATKIPDGIARSSTAVGTPEDVIPVFERFMDAGVNHFVIRFWVAITLALLTNLQVKLCLCYVKNTSKNTVNSKLIEHYLAY